MRENCTYGSEGGEARKGLPYPYRVRLPHAYSYVRIVVPLLTASFLVLAKGWL
jgi:hypothetical protein